MTMLWRALTNHGHRLTRPELDDLFLWEIGMLIGADQTTINPDDPVIQELLAQMDTQYVPPSASRQG